MNLKANDIFWTIQGEGAHAGRRALFIRLPYCNLKCSWCDTEFDSWKEYSDSELWSILTSEESGFVVITGGEPTMNKQFPKLAKFLWDRGYEVAIESNGCFPIPRAGLLGWVTISPKADSTRFKGKEAYYIHPDAEREADEFKYVVDENFPMEILDRHDTSDGRRYSLSPEFTNMHENVQKIIEYQKTHPEWLLSLQTHKWIGVP